MTIDGWWALARIGRESPEPLSIDQKEQPIFGVSIVRAIKERRPAFISTTAGSAYHFSGSSLIRNVSPELRSLILKGEMASSKLGYWF
jgi:hypothetical protein